MKRITLCLWLTGLAAGAFGQLSSGGFPLSVREKISTVKAPVHTYVAPDWEQAQAEQKSNADMNFQTPYLIGLLTPSDIRFPESGSFTYLPDGRIIWRTAVNIEGAPALGFYYDAFHLPEGVSYFISNRNGQHILGAYTSKNNQGGMFANEALQGSMAMLELDIAPEVSTADISLHINEIVVYYTSIDYLKQYASTAARPTGGEPDTIGLEGNSSTCHINATCPLGWNYSIQRRAALQIITKNGNAISVCSATMLNNTGNAPGNCTAHVLTASHCEGSNKSASNESVFQQMLLRFNYEKPNCNNMLPATVHTLNGVELISRSFFTPPLLSPAVNGDFLLLKPKQAIPADWEVNLNGWNRADSLPSELQYPERYLGFHHPFGDIKKITTYKNLNSMGEGGGDDGPGTHWEVNTDSGRVERGSSGHGFIDKDGYTVGIASLAGIADTNCAERVKGGASMAYTTARFSKFSYVWDYMKDGDTSFRKLKPWLDPVGSGVITLNPVSSTCEEPYSGTPEPEPIGIRAVSELEKNVVLYPNPTSTGNVILSFNFNERQNLQINVYNIAGVLLKKVSVNNVENGNYAIDLSEMSNGMYLFLISNGNVQLSKKVMVNK